jgi:hypothetical protein
VQQPALVARLHAFGIDPRGYRQLETEPTLRNTGRVVHGVFAARRQLPAALDDEAVVEQLDVEIVFVDARQIHRDLDGPRRLGHVRCRPPAGLHQQAEGLVLPRRAKRPGLRGDAQGCGAVGHASVAHEAHSIVRAAFRLSIVARRAAARA